MTRDISLHTNKKMQMDEANNLLPHEFGCRVMHSGCVEVHQISKLLPRISQVEAGQLELG